MCAKQLRLLYEEMAGWMGDLDSSLETLEDVAEKYHDHLRKAQISLKEHRLLPKVKKGDRKVPISENLPVSVYFDGIRSAHNVGSMIRTADAFRLGTLYFSPKTPFVDHKQVKDTSMGAWVAVTCRKATTIEDLPRPWIVLEETSLSSPIGTFDFPSSFTLIVGNEEYGVSQTLLEQADAFVSIAMRGCKNSLNVANAFAIAASFIDQNLRNVP